MKNTINQLMSIDQANDLVKAGKVLLLAGEAAVLQQIAKGNWIGGTIPYFMDNDGGCLNKDAVFVTDLTDVVLGFDIKQYEADQLAAMFADRYKDGFSYILMPAFSEVHSKYSLEMRYVPELFDVVTMGWVTGIQLDQIGKQKPMVVNGQTGAMLDSCLLAMHCQLPAHQYADISIVNIYEQDPQSPTITFSSDSFASGDCRIDGQAANLADYLNSHQIDTNLPLVADYSDALINTTIEKVDADKRSVSFLAPVVQNQEYKIAKAIPDGYQRFADRLPSADDGVVCSCNCIVNYMGLGLENKKTGVFNGPFTFGEIAYILLNQTMVLLSVKER